VLGELLSGFAIGTRAEANRQELQNQRIVVQGFTDIVPIGPELRSRFPSNWELSTARATDVVRYLVAQG
jgi:chemotaxis protein MotB